MQLTMFADLPDPRAYAPNPDKVRRRLHRLLDEARAADRFPWARTTVTLYRDIVFPDLSAMLPADERDALRSDFADEMARLAAACRPPACCLA